MKIMKMIYDKFLFPLVKAGRENPFSMVNAMKRISERGHIINSVIDVGASDGQWSKKFMKFYPNSEYFLIEAQKEHEKALISLKKDKENVNHLISAAGNEVGRIYFNNEGLFGGVASKVPFKKNNIEVNMVSIDNVIEKNNLKPPYLIKLDTHGFEREILEGAKKALRSTEILIIESYAHPIGGTFRFFELCEYMKTLGFLPIDLVDLMLRKRDNTLWQMDLFFTKDSHEKFKHNTS